jgi:hypothetical protein
MVVAGCAAQGADPERRRDDTEAELTVTLGALAEQFERHGDFMVSPRIEAPDGVTRVGALVDLRAVTDLPALEARAYQGDLELTEWLPLRPTWGEEDLFVAVAELGVTADAVRVRLPVEGMDLVELMRVGVAHVDDAELALEESDGDTPDVSGASSALRAELGGLGIVTREAWGAARTRCTTRDTTKTRMAVHYTVTPSSDPARQVRGIQRYHMDTRGWCDVGYHFLVGVDGTIYEGRPLELLGSHVGGNNSRNIGVSFVGCFHSSGCESYPPTRPPEAMIEAGGRLLGTLSRLYGIDISTATVKGHRDHSGASTSCPGDHLHARLSDLRAIGRSRALGGAGGSDSPADEGGGTSPAPAPTEPTPPPAPSTDPAPSGACGGLSCGACEATSGCGYCASRGACAPAGSACAWGGDVDTNACWDALWPCWVASCWNPHATFPACSTYTIDENFSSGRYSVHRYWASLPAGRSTLTLARTAGSFAPAIVVTDRAGKMIYAGDLVSLHPDVSILAATTGRSESAASVELVASRATDVYVYVTGWSILDAGFRGPLATSSRYRLSATNGCR